jgi:GGDEF domain-containing protein
VNKRIVFLIVPGAIVLIVTAALLTLAPQSPVLIDAAYGFPYVALAATAALAWRLQNTRIFAASVLLTATYMTLQPTLLGNQPLAHALFAIFVPPGISLLTFAKDRGFTMSRLAAHIGLAFAPLAVGAFTCAGRVESATANLNGNVIDPIYTDWTGLPQAAAFMVAFAFGLNITRFALNRRALEAGLTWLIILLACALAAPATSTARGIWMIAAALVLIIALVETAHSMAFEDELTGLRGRRALTQALQALRAPYAVAIVDVDHFKSFNDEHGHDVGDQVLRMVAARLRQVGGGGVAYRSGGEEFTIVFPGLKKREAVEHAERLRENVANARFALRSPLRPLLGGGENLRGQGGQTTQLNVTISVGVAAAVMDTANVQALLSEADQAMYRAKSAGRNRVMA